MDAPNQNGWRGLRDVNCNDHTGLMFEFASVFTKV
jgi:hypothetical protein